MSLIFSLSRSYAFPALCKRFPYHQIQLRSATTRSWFGKTSTTKPLPLDDPTSTTTTATLPAPPSKFVKLKSMFVVYWKGLLKEYKDVLVESYKDGKSKPIRSTFYFIFLGGLCYLVYTNPTEESFYQEFQSNREEVDLVGIPIRSPKSEAHLRTLSELNIRGQLRYLNFLLFSVMWKHDDDSMLGLYPSQCDYLKPLWSEMLDERFVDIGFSNKWVKSAQIMIDYDVNETEWVKMETSA